MPLIKKTHVSKLDLQADMTYKDLNKKIGMKDMSVKSGMKKKKRSLRL